MNKAYSVIRISTLLILSCIGLVFLLGEEQDENTFTFFLHVIIDKAIGLFLFFVTFCLYTLWHKHDKWIAAFGRWCESITEEEDKPVCKEEKH